MERRGRGPLHAAKQRDQQSTHRGTGKRAEDGDGREPRQHLALSRACHVGDHRHGDRAVDGRGESVQEAYGHEGFVAGDEEVQERDEGEEAKARQHRPAASDDVRDGPGRHLEEDARHRGDAHGQPDGLGPCAQIQGEEGQDGVAGKGVGEPGKKADRAQGRDKMRVHGASVVRE